MISNISIKKLLLIIFLSANVFQATTSCFFARKYRVQVVNRLPSNNSSLFLHCASGDDELGKRTIYAGQTFEWAFCASGFSKTLFFCHLWWGSKDRAFEVFNSKHSINDCRSFLCSWSAMSDGIYYQDGQNGELLDKRYNWN
ncbi:hypothetical protein ACP275_03G053400 [Erythranthe tilingii]